ncbi:MAG: hypothetical protein GXP30_13700, partial [Verrucomicrobia bacterium]|nr:hypothetical protein [Verrucomicrobiota bacterium]
MMKHTLLESRNLKRCYRGAVASFFAAMASLMFVAMTLQAASPDLRTTTPRGGQRGTEVKVALTGTRLDGAQEVLFHQKGMSFKDMVVVSDVNKIKAKAAFDLANKNVAVAAAATKADQAKKVAVAKAALDAATKHATTETAKATAAKVKAKTDFDLASKNAAAAEAAAKVAQTKIAVATKAVLDKATKSEAAITAKTTAAKAKAQAAFDLANKNAVAAVAKTKADQVKKVAAAKTALDKANKAPTNKVEVTLVIAPDCELGEHHIRLRTTSGASYARTFWVSQFPTVTEVEPNDDFDKPQEVALNVTIEGAAKPEEVDFYKIKAKKGQRISVEVEGMRINDSKSGNILIDPYVAILDKKRFELAVSDDSALLKQDSVLSIIAPEDGEYIIEVRDSAYQGRGRYRVHIGTFPRPLGVYPAGGKAG